MTNETDPNKPSDDNTQNTAPAATPEAGSPEQAAEAAQATPPAPENIEGTPAGNVQEAAENTVETPAAETPAPAPTEQPVEQAAAPAPQEGIGSINVTMTKDGETKSKTMPINTTVNAAHKEIFGGTLPASVTLRANGGDIQGSTKLLKDTTITVVAKARHS